MSSNFKPSKQHLREALLFCFHLKKSSYESHGMMVEAYGEGVVSVTMCKKWYARFRSGDFSVKDKERSGQPKKFRDEDFIALLEQDPSLTPKALSELLHVEEKTVKKRACTLGFKRNKQGKWKHQMSLKGCPKSKDSQDNDTPKTVTCIDERLTTCTVTDSLENDTPAF